MKGLFRGLSVLTLAASPVLAQPTVTYTVDFFPELPSPGTTTQLRFLGPTQGTITNSRLFVTFTPAANFDASTLVINIFARTPNSPSFGDWTITGSDLGWEGAGPFTASLSTHDLDGALVAGGTWGFNLGSTDDPPSWAGQFSADTRFEFDIALAPCAADADGSGVIEPADVAAFVNRWFTDLNEGTFTADIDLNFDITPADIATFVSLWFSGVGTTCQ